MDRESKLRGMDWVLTIAVLSLTLLGSLLVWSATRHTSGDGMLKKQLLTVVVGGAIAVVAARIDFRNLRTYAPFVFGVACLGLLAVMVPGVGSNQNGTSGWIALPGGFNLQPSEFAKLGFVVVLAMLLSEKRDLEYGPRNFDVVRALLIAGIPMILIMLQPDLGTALVFIAVVLGMLAVSVAPARWLVIIVLGVVVSAFMVVHLGFLKDYQLKRLTSFANPTADTQGAGWDVHQSGIAIGSGGLTGKGLFHGAQTNGGFVYASSTDFVYSVAGEELGFAGAGAIIGLTGIILFRGIRIATRSEDMFGRLVAVGVVCWFSFQAFENIGMNLGIMPVTGIPLPFVSYGGSAMIANMLAIGLLQNIHLATRET